MKGKIGALQVCLVAMAAGLNIVGAQVALLLRLPILLDSMGTLLIGALLGPFYGMLPSLISGILLGMTTDIYSLYFAPAGMLTGFMAGMVLQRKAAGKLWLPVETLLICLPGATLSAIICAKIFDGVTSSGSTILVQLLGKTPLGLFLSVWIVQVAIEFFDRMIGIVFVRAMIRALPKQLRERFAVRK